MGPYNLTPEEQNILDDFEKDGVALETFLCEPEEQKNSQYWTRHFEKLLDLYLPTIGGRLFLDCSLYDMYHVCEFFFISNFSMGPYNLTPEEQNILDDFEKDGVALETRLFQSRQECFVLPA
jgi:hypothetical protein